jgi:uncharacterized membrane protein
MKMFQWTKNKVKNISDGVKDTSKKLVASDTILENAEQIKKMSENILSPKKMIAESKVEKFEEAIDRLKVSPNDLENIFDNYSLLFYLSICFSFLLFLSILYKLFILKVIWDSLVLLSIFSFCLVNAFKYSFRCLQIKYRKLCTVNDWWNKSNEWIPQLNISRIINRFK